MWYITLHTDLGSLLGKDSLRINCYAPKTYRLGRAAVKGILSVSSRYLRDLIVPLDKGLGYSPS